MTLQEMDSFLVFGVALVSLLGGLGIGAVIVLVARAAERDRGAVRLRYLIPVAFLVLATARFLWGSGVLK